MPCHPTLSSIAGKSNARFPFPVVLPYFGLFQSSLPSATTQRPRMYLRRPGPRSRAAPVGARTGPFSNCPSSYRETAKKFVFSLWSRTERKLGTQFFHAMRDERRRRVRESTRYKEKGASAISDGSMPNRGQAAGVNEEKTKSDWETKLDHYFFLFTRHRLFSSFRCVFLSLP